MIGGVPEGSPEGLPDLALRGIEEFNRGEFYECHEYLEEAWMQEPRRVRFLYQGILQVGVGFYHQQNGNWRGATGLLRNGTDRKSTRLNSSHANISYAVFCLKKKHFAEILNFPALLLRRPSPAFAWPRRSRSRLEPSRPHRRHSPPPHPALSVLMRTCLNFCH